MGRRSAVSPSRLQVRNVGQIKQADVTFGDLTVLVGPQATGKSIFLQLLKLVVDRDHIHKTFARYNVNVSGDDKAFLDGYFGDGMSGLCTAESEIKVDNIAVSLADYATASKRRNPQELLFFIPAQRVVSLRDGKTQNFGQFNFGDPYALRAFSDAVHDLLQNQFGGKSGEIFPQPNRLNPILRAPIGYWFNTAIG
jgi:hypothetical protein